jgi:hypothetical protein
MQHAPAVDVGQVDVERDRGALSRAAMVMAAAPRGVTSALNPCSVSHVEEEVREVQVVLDDQQHLVVLPNVSASIGEGCSLR